MSVRASTEADVTQRTRAMIGASGDLRTAETRSTDGAPGVSLASPSSRRPGSSVRRALVARLGLAAIGVFSVGTLASCNILGPVMFIASDDRTPAVYELPPKKATVVIVDDRNSRLPSRTARDKVAETAQKNLLANKAVSGEVIDSESVQGIMSADRFTRPRSVTALGRAVGAQQVIWVTVDSFSLVEDQVRFLPTATVRVKVIDVEQDKRIFPGPDQAEGHTFTVQIRTRSSEPPKNEADRVRAQNELAERIGLRVAEMFYKSKPREADRKIGAS